VINVDLSLLIGPNVLHDYFVFMMTSRLSTSLLDMVGNVWLVMSQASDL
jgi:hypothetical protein